MNLKRLGTLLALAIALSIPRISPGAENAPGECLPSGNTLAGSLEWKVMGAFCPFGVGLPDSVDTETEFCQKEDLPSSWRNVAKVCFDSRIIEGCLASHGHAFGNRNSEHEFITKLNDLCEGRAAREGRKCGNLKQVDYIYCGFECEFGDTPEECKLCDRKPAGTE